jgi:2-desacetyl-2-hydroxyethyl bacteriochlorophyllide A dehydrogenase
MSGPARAPERIRAIVFPGRDQVVLRDDLTAPELGDDEIEVRTTFSGLSVGTERNFLTGGSYELGFPQLAGYQLAGRVIRAGPRAFGFGPGDRVFAHLFWSRGFPGESFTWVGAHASLHVGPTTGPVHRLPDDIPDDEASLLSIASIGLHGAARGHADGGRVLVFGLGMIGLFAAQAAAATGAHVIAVDPHPNRRQAASDLGIRDVLDARAGDALWTRLASLGPVDAVLETSGGAGIIGALIANRVVRNGARVVLLGGRERHDYPINRAQEIELELVHSMHHSEDDVVEVLRLRRAGAFRIGPLITHRLAPSEVPGFWRGVLDGDRDHLGVVIDWSRT